MLQQPDLPDRTLVLELNRLEERRSENDLLSEIQAYRDVMWSELLDDLNRVVRRLKQQPQSDAVQFRMADFASLALKIGDEWGCRADVEQALTKLQGAQSRLVLQDDPISVVLAEWLRESRNIGRPADAGTLFEEWKLLAAQRSLSLPVANGVALGKRLGQIQTALKAQFEIEVTLDTHTKQNNYRFWPTGKAHQGKTSIPSSVTSTAEAGPESVEKVGCPNSSDTAELAADGETFEELVMALSGNR